MQKKFAQKLDEHNKHTKMLLDITNDLMALSKVELEKGNVDSAEQIAAVAEKCADVMAKVSNAFEDEYGDEVRLLAQVVGANKEQKQKAELYLNAEEQEKRRIAFTHCEDEEGCGFLVEFKHPNSTFFFCKEHGAGINLDLSSISVEGAACPQHGKMERYDIVKDDNVCPKCESTTLAILSVGRDRGN